MKVTKESVDYRKASGVHRCGGCSMYRSGGQCTAVRGDIQASYVCKLWERATRKEG